MHSSVEKEVDPLVPVSMKEECAEEVEAEVDPQGRCQFGSPRGKKILTFLHISFFYFSRQKHDQSSKNMTFAAFLPCRKQNSLLPKVHILSFLHLDYTSSLCTILL